MIGLAFAALPATAQTGASSPFSLSVSTAIDSAGNSIIVSQASANNQSFIQIRKVSPQGQIAWVRNFSAGSLSIPAGVAVDALGNAYVGGNDAGLAESFLLKYGPDGVFISSQPTPDQGATYWPFLAGIALDPATNSLYAAQTFLDPNHGGSSSVLALEYGPDLSLKASQTVNDGPGISDEATGITVDSFGNVFVGLELFPKNGLNPISRTVEFSPQLAGVISGPGLVNRAPATNSSPCNNPFVFVGNSPLGPGPVAPIAAVDSRTSQIVTTFQANLPIEFGVAQPIDVLAVSPDGNLLAVLGDFGDLNVFDARTFSLIRTIPFDPPVSGPAASGIVITPDSRFALTASGGGVAAYDMQAGARTAFTAGFNNAFDIDVLPNGKKAYAADLFSRQLSVLSVPGLSLLSTITLGAGQRAVGIRPDGKEVWVLTSTKIQIIDPTTDSIVATIPVGFTAQDVVFSTDSGKAYVAAGTPSVNLIHVFDTPTRTEIAAVPVGAGPVGIALTCEGSRLFSADNISQNVSVVDAAANAFLANIQAGPRPTTISAQPFLPKAAPTSSLSIASGNNQTATITEALAQPLQVKVTDGSGNPKSNVAIGFAITAEPNGAVGTLTVTSATTDSNGIASTSLTLGNAPGAYQVTATCSQCSPTTAIFAETAVPPQLKISLSATSVAPSDPRLAGVSLTGNPATSVEVDLLDNLGKLLPQQMPVSLSVSAVEFSGGHAHDTSRPVGTLSGQGVAASSVVVATTNANGQLFLVYTSTSIGGQEKISASLASIPAALVSTIVNVAVVDSQGLGLADISALPISSFASLTGTTGQTTYPGCSGATLHHPSNHWANGDMVARALSAIIEFYNETGIKVGINDMSLQSGGMFDICGDWQLTTFTNTLGKTSLKGHACHRGGNSIDIDKKLTNGQKLTPDRIKRLTTLMKNAGGRRVNEGPIHYQFPGSETCFGAGGS